MVTCDLCGKKNELTKAIVEGTLLSVCIPCSKFGNVVHIDKPTIKKSRFVEIDRYVEEIAPDFAEKIKMAREKLSLKQEELALKINEKVSVIQHLESGKIRPQITTARKLEKFLGIKLIESASLPEKAKINVKDTTLTIGDILKLEKNE